MVIVRPFHSRLAVVYMIVCGLGFKKKVGGKHSFSSDDNKVILFLESDHDFFRFSHRVASYRDFEISPVINILCGF